ncbi:hypothetical protein GQ43DRAFT_472654 [Delitschia confertaspora ATCC 74209]|uniref:Uncharacterized protein n=1 Tax=Delitschia confertaspora ATCC 74209 TaxID=1513339 RepID=A0A9P4JJW6_9PLEO|nr:hypothetical protein GQ43DRAFT_472654 [Delitschia confertaspora ATCC 74209]
MTNFAGGDSPLSVTGSIVGIVALLISVSTIIQALFIYFSAYRDAPAELCRITSSISNTVDENSHRLRPSHIPGPINVELGKSDHNQGRWTGMLQEYYDAHLELNEELDRIKREGERTNSVFNLNRFFWVFKRKDLEESVKRVETLRMRKMAVALNALAVDVSSIKDTLERIEARIPEGPLRLPAPRAPQEPDEGQDLPRRLNLYSESLFGESVTNIVQTSLDSR